MINSMKTYDWIVVGGGIKGAALAYELVKTGLSVLLLEQETTPANASRHSYGGLAYWSGNTPITCQILEEAIARYRILDQELAADIQFRELDLLLTISVGSDPETTAASYAHVGIPPQLLSVQEACELEPLLNPQAIAGALTVKHGHIHPEKTTQAYIQAFLRLGGEMQITQVLEVFKQGVKTTTATYHAANVVICAGGLSRKLLKASGISMKVYFTHAEIIKTLPTDMQLRTLVMPANLQRLKLEAQATQVDELWNQPSNELVPPILDAGAIQFLDGSLRLGQISRIITDPHAEVDSKSSEQWLRNSITQVLPALGNLPGTWHKCLVEFTQTRLPVVGAIPEFENIHLFTGFSSPLAMVPSLAKRFAKYASGNEDEILVQLSPRANVF